MSRPVGLHGKLLEREGDGSLIELGWLAILRRLKTSWLGTIISFFVHISVSISFNSIPIVMKRAFAITEIAFAL